MAKIQSLNSVAGKETIYVDVDDEITAIIDKVQTAKGKIVALVLPKRAVVLQSIVNMKLLKRGADDAKKNLVLVTTEAGLLPLAGTVGIYVANTPNSKPVIPVAPKPVSEEPEDLSEPLKIVDGTTDDNSSADDADFDPASAKDKPIGELAAAGAVAAAAGDDVDESIDMSDEVEDGDTPSAAAAAKKSKPSKDKKLKVPNFDSFRKRLALGVLLIVLLIAGYVYAFTVLPSAKIAIHSNAQTITTNMNLTLDTSAKSLDPENNVVPAVAQSQQKTASQQVAATGQQNNGEKATGSVTMTAQKCGGNPFVVPSSVPAGTSISTGGKTYAIQDTVSFHGTGSSGSCYSYAGNGSVEIIALKGGADYNVDSATFKVTGREDVTATGSADGGTDDISRIVSQSDIDNAKSKITSADTSSMKQQLALALKAKGLQAVPSTFLASDPTLTSSEPVGSKADNVTVTAVTTYTMLGVKNSDLTQLVEASVNTKLDKGKQVILDNGVSDAAFDQQSPGTPTGAAVAMGTKSLVGPQLDVEKLKTSLAGKKAGDVKTELKKTPGVSDVDVHFSPFWVNSIPHKANKVTITILKANE